MPVLTTRVFLARDQHLIAFSYTKDFRSWPAPKLIMAPDAHDDLDIDFYGGNYFPYRDAPTCTP